MISLWFVQVIDIAVPKLRQLYSKELTRRQLMLLSLVRVQTALYRMTLFGPSLIFVLGGYPHVFGNNRKLKFSDACNGKTLYEFPLLHGDNIFGGGNAGLDRVVFYVYTKDPDTDPTDDGAYCGVMTHEGAPRGEFNLCSVED